MATKLTSVLKPRKKGMSPQKKKKKIILSDADQAIGASEKRVARALVYPSASSTDVAEDEDDVEEMLRQFDLDAKFGPCVGLSRIERWERAQRHGLCPPQNIRDVLERVGGEPNCLWEGRV
ncbi:DNA polymerase delta subunit 4-like [Selaginella moellendorffii]|nr:DNA polymerase delta subunit 4-like [Selaginella moellendorffii]XP_024545066.1 DNA polymerase delta subunit 4-like [Selaginella moellendorffii]|eukprot:XP_024533309.1 DNA polymerase delta subunit 4-like [Selaginella moellendorffii]